MGNKGIIPDMLQAKAERVAGKDGTCCERERNMYGATSPDGTPP